MRVCPKVPGIPKINLSILGHGYRERRTCQEKGTIESLPDGLTTENNTLWDYLRIRPGVTVTEQPSHSLSSRRLWSPGFGDSSPPF